MKPPWLDKQVLAIALFHPSGKAEMGYEWNRPTQDLFSEVEENLLKM